MKALDEEDLQVIREYAALLQTMDEAFHYLVESISESEKLTGDRILGDIFAVFQQILTAHGVLEQTLEDDSELKQVLDQFGEVLEHSFKFNGKLNDYEFKQIFVQETFAPAFLEWSRAMQVILKRYIAH
ncbi:hypothetical protein SAMN05877753_106229 [Bacillus oleivorans]|uniref:DUF8042 domain-containing protein n=1 Tax=Bacillus oleivorans TaxID=1448271 RepID=A0A285D0N0_9BACI|nr:hypothetical protein [Bacillus oleivorans]SNX72856.1 hypothetical protein SAMN05877753_106229 [Bacillus oleivorans]